MRVTLPSDEGGGRRTEGQDGGGRKIGGGMKIGGEIKRIFFGATGNEGKTPAPRVAHGKKGTNITTAEANGKGK